LVDPDSLIALSMADADGQAWLAAHKARAENLIWLFYAVAALSVIALIAAVKWQRSSIALASTILVLGVVSLGAGGYIAYAGGKIRHREFRNEPPPKETAAAAQPSSVGTASAQVLPDNGVNGGSWFHIVGRAPIWVLDQGPIGTPDIRRIFAWARGLTRGAR
jgi:hypothetical protein